LRGFGWVDGQALADSGEERLELFVQGFEAFGLVRAFEGVDLGGDGDDVCLCGDEVVGDPALGGWCGGVVGGFAGGGEIDVHDDEGGGAEGRVGDGGFGFDEGCAGDLGFFELFDDVGGGEVEGVEGDADGDGGGPDAGEGEGGGDGLFGGGDDVEVHGEEDGADGGIGGFGAGDGEGGAEAGVPGELGVLLLRGVEGEHGHDVADGLALGAERFVVEGFGDLGLIESLFDDLVLNGLFDGGEGLGAVGASHEEDRAELGDAGAEVLFVGLAGGAGLVAECGEFGFDPAEQAHTGGVETKAAPELFVFDFVFGGLDGEGGFVGGGGDFGCRGLGWGGGGDGDGGRCGLVARRGGGGVVGLSVERGGAEGGSGGGGDVQRKRGSAGHGADPVPEVGWGLVLSVHQQR